MTAASIMVGGKHDHPQAVADLHIPTTGAEGHILKCDSVPKTCCYCLRPELGYSKNIHQHNRKDVSWILALMNIQLALSVKVAIVPRISTEYR